MSKLQTTADEESRLSVMVGADMRRSTLGTVLQSVVNYGRPVSSLPQRDPRRSVTGKRTSIPSQVERPFGTGLCCELLDRVMFIYAQGFFAVRTGVSDHLRTLNKDAQDNLRSYVLRVVVHKVSLCVCVCMNIIWMMTAASTD